jgi:two-component system sensor histidine kinase/response regulator
MSSPVESPRPELAGRRILIVDDDRLNVRILSSILKPEGYELLAAHSGEEALAVYDQFKPDLVLLDVMMPGMNGFEVCRTLRDRHAANLAPVIFITAKSESDDVVEGLEAGGVDYLPKPFKGREALARLRTHLHNRLLNEQQRQLVAQLSTANHAKNRLLGMVAHDLRNPLASIRGLTDFLCDGTVGALTPDQLDLVQTIRDTSQSMLTMVNELLDLSVIESGELKIQPEQRPIAELLTKSVYLNNINAAKKGSHIEVEEADDAVLNIDTDKIKQVVDNLLSNAIKFSPPNSTIRVSTQRDQSGYSVLVRDQGPGIPEGERHKLFKDFSQTSVKPTAGEKSTGLGLAICKRIMESHGGSIGAESVPAGGGSIFRITFPLAA